MVAPFPEVKKYNKDLITSFESIKETISAIRTYRKSKDIPNKETLKLLVRPDKDSFDNEFFPVICKLCNLSEVPFNEEKQEETTSLAPTTTLAPFMEGYDIQLDGKLDIEGEIAKIQEDLDYNRGFLVNVMKKLENERFVQNAPNNVLELERKKKSDAESKIKSLEERMKELKNL
jgi:valyl-tRNA synthetase